MSAHVTALCRSGFFQLRQLCPFSGHSLRKLSRHWFRRSYLAVWTTATRFCMEWPRTSWGESSRRRKPQHASTPEPDVVTTLRRCYVSCTGFLFGGEWSSNSPVWCARHCAVKCLRTWLMISISSPKSTDDPFGLPLITCVRCHVRTTALEAEALALPVREFGTVCHVACEHLTSATNILKHYWRHNMFD